jgi:hypothetical protein
MASKKKASKKKSPKKTKALVPQVVKRKGITAFPVAMDSTAIQEFHIVDDTNYSQKVIDEAESNYDLDELKHLMKKGDELEVLTEGRRQILELWRGIERLSTHTSLYVVRFLIYIGEILDLVKSSVSTRKFTIWRKTVFRHMHERYLQQARQLARMGEFASKYAAMGKKRLLSLAPLLQESGSGVNALLTKYPFPDLTQDMDGELLKEHADTLITMYRFNEAGVNFVSFDQAALIAGYKKSALEVKAVEKIGNWLNMANDTREKKKRFNRLLMDKLHFPQDGRETQTSEDSLHKLLWDFIRYCRNHEEDMGNQEWIESQRQSLDQDTLRETNRLIKSLARKLGYRLSDARR